jgi:D-alanyl-D-alanine carboxypeptidase
MEMFQGAANEGISLWVASGFRSYETQSWLYNNYVSIDGKAAADTYSARPGHSEHQSGLAFDLNIVADYFANTPEGIWLANNCWKYGFIIRYQAGKEAITGYKYEPWHVRYLGKDTAKAVYDSGLCLEEYLGITSVYSY